ncbi:hypothetical protein [Mycobacterium shigaense]|uniref:Uncharacterized protein n=1 Tax=Mycobacterium shigaense TaxID=722731 RepID=A0A1Z4ED52_9MYCO|nr:hypothetical protein [Mycobacterium shigaense]PRI16929.1 hypothetical protein B2J96_00155 [Mycobacterium shigaense]BAX90887.1 hypothetical protein MSG_00724 [Mycobacterium shigaense]
MVSYRIDLARYPEFLHRIVRSWYTWQGAYLLSQGKYPGYDQREPRLWETEAQVFWDGRPPEMTSINELGFIDDGGVSEYLVWENGRYFIDEQERGSRDKYWMLNHYPDAEKLLLFSIGKRALSGRYIDSPAMDRLERAVDPRVTLSKPDPLNYPGRVSLRVNGEDDDRGWIGETDATAASHIVFLSFEDLDSLLREGLPADWFTISTQGD